MINGMSSYSFVEASTQVLNNAPAYVHHVQTIQEYLQNLLPLQEMPAPLTAQSFATGFHAVMLLRMCTTESSPECHGI